MQTASPEDRNVLEKELFKISEEAFQEFQTFDDEFLRIRNTNMKLEEKIHSLNELLDKKMEETSPLDMAANMATCEIIYKEFWAKLDIYSQKYLAMANYLFKLCSNDDKDFSPPVLEFGRAAENELDRKISLYGELKSAISSYTNNGEYYIPARAMVKYLSYLSDEDLQNAYNDALKQYLIENGVNHIPISESTFTCTADELFDKFRNTAAHPGNTMKLDDAEKCKEKSKKILKRFMSAV